MLIICNKFNNITGWWETFFGKYGEKENVEEEKTGTWNTPDYDYSSTTRTTVRPTAEATTKAPALSFAEGIDKIFDEIERIIYNIIDIFDKLRKTEGNFMFNAFIRTHYQVVYFVLNTGLTILSRLREFIRPMIYLIPF